MGSIPPIKTTVGLPKCKHPKARQKAAQRQCLSWLSGRNPTRTGLIRLTHDRQATIQQAEGSLGHLFFEQQWTRVAFVRR